jgi:DNA recombination protein Rad52
MKTPEQITAFLEKSIPRDEVSTRDGGKGQRLSYLETWRVIDLLNEAFGNLGWDSETKELVQVTGTQYPTYRATVRLRAIVQVGEGSYLNITKEGSGWGADKSDRNQHEMAVKEAESDALKRAAMKFGKRLGLALYDKSQEFVADEEPKAAPAVAPSARQVVKTQAKPSVAPKELAPVPAAKDREVVIKLIKSTAKVIWDKKIATKEETQKILESQGVKSSDELNETQAQEVLSQLQGMLQ